MSYSTSTYDGDVDIAGTARGAYGHALAERRMAHLGYDFNRLKVSASNQANVTILDELRDPRACAEFVTCVEREGLHKSHTLDIARKVAVVQARLPYHYQNNASKFDYVSLGLEPVGRAFSGVLQRARNTIKRSR